MSPTQSKERLALEKLIDRAGDADSPLLAGFEIFDRRSARLRPVGAAVAATARAGHLTVRMENLAGSFLHMHANRLLRGAARAQELVLYDFLTRYVARRNQKAAPARVVPQR